MQETGSVPPVGGCDCVTNSIFSTKWNEPAWLGSFRALTCASDVFFLNNVILNIKAEEQNDI